MFVPISDTAWINTTETGPVEMVYIDEVEGKDRIVIQFKSGRDYIMLPDMDVTTVLATLNRDEALHLDNNKCMGSWSDIHHWVHPKCQILTTPHDPHYIATEK